MSARSAAARATVIAALAALLLTACGGDGGGDGTGGDASVLPSGPATISGVLTVNGEPREGEDVSLDPGTATTGPTGASGASGASGATGPTGPVSTTAADGSFTFANVEPGSYSLSVAVVVEDAFSSDSFGLSWDDPCAVEGFQVFNAAVSDDTTGEAIGVIAAASNQVTSTNADQVTPIEVGPGDQITVNIAFVCAIGAGA